MTGAATAMSGGIRGFRRQLEAAATDFICQGELGGTTVRLRFLGDLHGVETIWDATIVTLQRLCRQRQAGGEEGAVLRSFIHVGPRRGDVRRLTVALDIPVVDRPAVRKVMVMVRNYRRLRVGCHEFGPPYDCRRPRAPGPRL